jgi:hypothetical protein
MGAPAGVTPPATPQQVDDALAPVTSVTKDVANAFAIWWKTWSQSCVPLKLTCWYHDGQPPAGTGDIASAPEVLVAG